MGTRWGWETAALGCSPRMLSELTMIFQPHTTGNRPPLLSLPSAAPDDDLSLYTPRNPAAYPSHLVDAIRLRDGARLTVRPIRSDDYRLELDFIRGLSKRSAYQRLLSSRKLRASEVMRLVR